MNFKNINVLVDGYNLELRQGTGVKTYSVSLIQALNKLGANIDILFSKYIKSDINKNKVISEVLFFDTTPQAYKLTRIDKINLALKVINGNIYKAKRINITDVVLKDKREIVNDKLLDYSGILNIPQCYEIANFLFKQYKFAFNVKTDKKIDIFHATYPLPITLKKARKITTIHDLIPLKLPYLTLDNKSFFYNLVKQSIHSSDIIITVSESTKKDILEIFDCAPEKICVTYQPIVINAAFEEEDSLSIILRRYNLENKKYILFVGAIEPKKNLSRLIDAYTTLELDIPLVIVGKKGWLWKGEIRNIDKLLNENYQRKVRLLDYVSNQDLKYLYQGAYCFVFPSLYEGFGLPPLEAMSLGCPVITSNVSSLPEICGDAALYIDPYNVNDIASKIDQLLNNSNLRAKLSETGRQRAELFSMENYVSRLALAYQKALGKT